MKNSQSNMSKAQSQSGSCSKQGTGKSSSGCHCGSKQAGTEVEELDIIEMEEK